MKCWAYFICEHVLSPCIFSEFSMDSVLRLVLFCTYHECYLCVKLVHLFFQNTVNHNSDSQIFVLYSDLFPKFGQVSSCLIDFLAQLFQIYFRLTRSITKLWLIYKAHLSPCFLIFISGNISSICPNLKLLHHSWHLFLTAYISVSQRPFERLSLTYFLLPTSISYCQFLCLDPHYFLLGPNSFLIPFLSHVVN